MLILVGLGSSRCFYLTMKLLQYDHDFFLYWFSILLSTLEVAKSELKL
jgi:hypothetical protein